MKEEGREGAAFLDEVRKKRGIEAVVASFRNLAEKREEQAVADLNDRRLSFPTVYALRKEIEQFGFIEVMHWRTRTALEWLREDQWTLSSDVQSVHPSLKWIVTTGATETIDAGYLKKIDEAAALLTMVFRDHSLLPTVADAIFYRCRNDLPYHYLVTAFLEAKNPHSLTLIADKLRSADSKEAACARKMLGFVPGINKQDEKDDTKPFTAFLRWMEENGPYLRYKGETFDTFSHPTPYVLVYAAKYGGHFVSVEDGTPIVKLTKQERRTWERFEVLPLEQQKRLAGLSFRKRRENDDEWVRWMQLSMKKQLKAAQGRENDD
ncbi:MAG TPA: hypothetical protein VFK44_10745 [Bacillales bacterium]|nr:hypothetical protein [Bacillales bacterium]